jgi:uncharacterized protein (TIGR03435 family)
LFACVLLLLSTAGSTAQQGAPAVMGSDAEGPAFEVASVRPAHREDGRRWFGVKLDASGRYEASAMRLSSLVRSAYVAGLDPVQVETDRGAPKWVNSDEFDIQAKIDERYMDGWSKLSDGQRMDLVRPMLRRLLAERFHLKVAVETRATPVYVLVQAKGGAHVKEVAPPMPVEGDALEAAGRWMNDHPGEAFPGHILFSGETCTARAAKIGDSVGQIAANSHADRIVIDETGLKGYYDFTMPMPGQKDEFPMHQVEEALGMKFEARNMPVKTYVIAWAERPSVD